MTEQLEMLGTIPNFHKWNWQNQKEQSQQVKLTQRLCVRNDRLPGSPRNRLINALVSREEDSLHVVSHVLEQMLGIKIPFQKPKVCIL